jgi:PEP-CTERM motif
MLRSTVFLFGVLGACASSMAAVPVWESTFDTTADGVVDLFDNNSGKVMIGSNNGGTQTISTQDNLIDAFTPDKAGRQIVGGLVGTDSFSGLYQFSWSGLDETAAEATMQYEAVGFLGNGAPQTRQIMGTLLRHWKVGADYVVAVDLAFGSVGFTNFGYKAGPSITLGTGALGTSYQLAIGFDAPTKRLTANLYAADGTLLGGQTGLIEFSTGLPGDEGIIAPPFATAQQELDAFAATSLGWSDYTGNFGGGLAVWEVDSLAYFDTADGAFPGAVDLAGDLNGDGFVGIGDLNIVLGNWNATVTPGDPLLGDPSGDGFVGIEDLNTVLGTWNNGTPPPASVVPEPASLALISMGGLVVLRRRRSRA